MTALAEVAPRPRRLYLDTSAYLCILLGEVGSDALVAETDGAELVSSVLLVIEARRNLVRLARDGTLPSADYAACMEQLDDDLALLELRDFTLDLCAASPLPPVATPRSLDLAHLRTALWFQAQGGLDRFVTMDAAQRAAAREVGLSA
jgi:predicted nucleic acid-binding protein